MKTKSTEKMYTFSAYVLRIIRVVNLKLIKANLISSKFLPKKCNQRGFTEESSATSAGDCTQGPENIGSESSVVPKKVYKKGQHCEPPSLRVPGTVLKEKSSLIV